MTRARRSSQRRTHGNFFLAGDSSRELKIGDVRAGDQQHEADGSQQEVERPPHIANDLFHQRHDAEGQSTVRRIHLGMVLPQARGNRVHLRLRLFYADTRPQLADDVVVFVIAVLGRIGGHGKRQHHLGLLGTVERGHNLARQRERSRHHADDLVRQSVERDRLAQDFRVRAITSRPGTVAEQRCRRASRLVFIGDEEPPQLGAHAEHGKQVRRHADRAHPLRLAFAGEVIVRSDGDGHLLQPVMAVLDVEVLRRREPVFGDPKPGRAVPQDHQPVRIFIRQRAEQKRIGDAEHGCGRANPDRQRQDRCDSEARTLAQSAKRIAKIEQGGVHHDRAEASPDEGGASGFCMVRDGLSRVS